MALLLSLKAKALALGAILLTVLGFFLRLKIVTKQRDKAKQKAAKYQAWSERQTKTAEVEAEIESKYSDLKRATKQDLKNDEIPDHLRNPRR
ncbi:hypothetical protein LCGC14_2032130 [marine sediment metagenome]|uniref:Uncharacterized protein n=1 Tax=marine sediment metagenome TaxID=412755 RepID=A0A0F9EUB2_9ZZZZ